MAKTSKKQIEEDEKKVIDQLQKNCMENLDLFAKKCGFSRQKVWRIIKNLEQEKVVWGYTAIVDPEVLKKKRYLLLMKRNTQKINRKIIDILLSREFEEVISKLGITIETSSYVHGEYDWIASFLAPDIVYAKKFSELVKITYPETFQRIDLVETLFDIKRQNIFHPDANKLKDYI
ncbi:MAG: Lrp/AsnC family transcriptional regulator [Candidatus Thermoplasmatota archaeon]|jgi:DNA-binding Lrp family transcriptional regulator|nr:Lrp/AsnC family transcriptional regulator [Candidatus Thermoplasmatota archaeon]